MSAAKFEKRYKPAEVSYRLAKKRWATIERAKALGRPDPFVAPIECTRAPQRKRAGAS